MCAMSEQDQQILRRRRSEVGEPLPIEEVVFGVQPSYGLALFAPRGEAERFSRQCYVFSLCATWGEVRAALLPDEVDELIANSCLPDDEPYPPPDDAAFDPFIVSGFEDGAWPVFPASNMLHWFPWEIAIEYGRVIRGYDAVGLGIEPEDADAVAERLTALGVRCVRDDELIRTMEVNPAIKR